MRVGILTADALLAAQLGHDLKQLGYLVTEEHEDIKDSAVLIADYRSPVLNRNDWPISYDGPIIAIIDSRIERAADLPAEIVDVLFYPCSTEELKTRIELGVHRGASKGLHDAFEWNGFKIDFASYEVTAGGTRLDLTYKEFELLKCLASSPGRVFTRSQLLKTVWGYDYTEGARTVDVHIRRLRSKLGTKYGPLIETVRHVGYRLASDVAKGHPVTPRDQGHPVVP